MDINYEDVFPNNNREIGQMDVSVEEEELIRESIRRIILEADGFQCNSHSLGFVDDQGNWLDTEGADHSDYLWANVYGMEDNRPGGYPMPDGWIKVSNASQIFFAGNSWDEVTPQQINGLIEMWGACSKYSRWIRKETESFEVIFGLIGPNRRMSNLEEMTIPDFLKRYGGTRTVDAFYGMLLGESFERAILEVSDFQCNKHSLGWIDDQGAWHDCKGMSHGEWLYRYYYNETEPVTIPPNWIKVSNANNIFFCGESFDEITSAQINGIITMWEQCNRYSRWIQSQPETFYVTFGLIEPSEMREELLYMEEMTIPEFLGKYGGRRAIENFYGMLLGENKRSTKRIISEVSEFGCNKHSLGWIDPNGHFCDITEYSETHDEWMDRYQYLTNPNESWTIGTIPPGWIKISNASEFWFEGNDWSEITPKQIDGMMKVWIECGKRHSRWIKKETDTRLINFMSPGGLEELTIGEFLDTYGSRQQQDIFFGWLLGE